MHCTFPYITQWTLSYNIWGHPEVTSFLIEYDEALMRGVEPELSQFNDRVQCIVNHVLSTTTDCNFNQIFDQWKYDTKRKRADQSSGKRTLTALVNESIKTHVTKIE